MASPSTSDREVPCNGCRRCCIGDAVRILRHEDAAQWHTEPHQLLPGELQLAHKANGECVYLAPHGCSIHEYKPEQCRTMDCRIIAARLTWTQARKMARSGMLPIEVWKRGRELTKRN